MKKKMLHKILLVIVIPIIFISIFSVIFVYFQFKANQISLESYKNTFIIFLAIIIIDSIVVSYHFAKLITKPITQLKEAIFKIRDGELDTKIDIEYGDEIGELAKSFSDMQVSLKNLYGKLEVKIKELSKEKTITENIITSIPDTLIIVNHSGIIMSVNKATVNLLGYKQEELVGKSLKKFVLQPKENLKTDVIFGKEWTKKMLQNGSTNVEIIYLTKDFRKISISLNSSLLKDDNNKILGIICIGKDITIQKESENELRQAKEHAEAANIAKTEFLANMSHEIRTPMNGIIGMTELALDTKLNKEQREYLETVQASADTLLTIINHILDFSKIEAGLFDMDNIDFNLKKIVTRTIYSHTFHANKKELELLWDIEENVPRTIKGDPVRVQQVLTNLIGNAIKFTEKGKITIHIENSKDYVSKNEVQLHFRVKDTGIGIPAPMQEKIFETFSQVDGSTTRKYGGTGLGLAITTKIVDMMKGKIWLESFIGIGSTFHFTARFGLPTRQERSRNEKIELHGKSAIIIDDNATNRKIFSEMLISWKMIPSEAKNGKEGLLKIKKAKERGRPFQLLLLDLQMPEMSGFDVAEKIKEELKIHDLPIIMLTSSDNKGDRDKYHALGIARYLVKPITYPYLLDAIKEVISKKKIRDGETDEIDSEEFMSALKRKINILVAEDNQINQLLAEKMLKKRGYEVTIVCNGKEVIDILEKENFDIILMDIQMPEVDGIEATKKIRENEKLTKKHIPIIAMTAHAIKGDKERFIAAGMDDYISKPMNTKELYYTIERCFTKQQNLDIDYETEIHSEDQIINFEELLIRVDNDLELAEELLEIFLQSYDEKVENIRNAIQQSNPEQLEKSAHDLKGSSGNISALQVYDISHKLEKIGRDNNFVNVQEILNLLEISLLNVEKYINEKKWRKVYEDIDSRRRDSIKTIT